ncbi:MAG: pilus assembly protein [Clostridium sp.]|jgi:hypothetical protein|nr:pilus assembly protein [Clostridium sp.]
MGLLKNKNGSLTLEAAISLPIFMCVFLTIAFFMRVVYIQNNVQYALNGAANELATYSYLYSVSGFQELNDSASAEMNKHGERASNHTKQLLEAFDAMGDNLQKGLDSVEGGLETGDPKKIENLKELYNQSKISAGTVKNVLNEVKDDPKREFVSIASLFLGAGYENIKDELSEPLIRFFMAKYIDNKIFSSGGSPGAYILAKKGKDPLGAFDFKSRLFTDNKSIDIMVRYKIKTALPINIFPEIPVEQRVTVRGWLDGDAAALSADEDSSDKESIWDKAPFVYGRYITDEELKKYPSKYPDSGDAYEVRSINLDCSTYKDIKKARSSLKSGINAFLSKTVKDKAIHSRTFIIVIPEGTLTEEVKTMLEELKSEALMADPPVKVVYKEGYGRQKLGSETEEQV